MGHYLMGRDKQGRVRLIVNEGRRNFLSLYGNDFTGVENLRPFSDVFHWNEG